MANWYRFSIGFPAAIEQNGRKCDRCPITLTLTPIYRDSSLTFYNDKFAHMLSKADIEARLKEVKPLLMEQFHVSRIGYFGSFVNDHQTGESDLDLLVEFSQPVGWGFFTLEKYLEQALGLPIDIVTTNALKERIKEAILNQVIFI